jgi:hypothetical protein
MSLQVAEQHYRAQARQEEATALLVGREWRRMDQADLDASWARIVDRLTLVLASAQLGSARAGAAYIGQSVDVDPVAQVNPNAWAGVASDGRPLDSLLYGAVVHTKVLIGHDYTPSQALISGGDWLDLATRTQVADASRGAAGVAITARPSVGWVRMVNPPCCQRCAVLAGKFFKWNTGFQRHPRCDCRHIPAENGQIPDGYTADIPASQIKDMTGAQRQAIADGADTNQVINSRRGRSKNGMTTSEGTTRRGLAGQRGARRRLTPEGIYRVSSTREEALQRLRDNGYIL